MTCKTENEFLDLLRRSHIRANDGRSLAEVYIEYLGRMQNSFPIRDFIINEFGLNINASPLDLNISGMLEGQEITVNSSNVTKRQNFTIAHEFAHYVLEHGNKIDYRANISYTPEQMLQEEQADCFAACILMPENLIRGEVERFKTQRNIESLTNHASEIIYQLSDRFDVSTSAVIKRLKALGYISGWIWI